MKKRPNPLKIGATPDNAIGNEKKKKTNNYKNVSNYPGIRHKCSCNKYCIITIDGRRGNASHKTRQCVSNAV